MDNAQARRSGLDVNCPLSIVNSSFLIAVIWLFATLTCAQEPGYPNKPVRMIVPYPPGGSVDFTGRELAAKLSEVWGQQVVLDNRGGAGSTLGHGLGAKAAPDGYTLLLGTS